MDKSLVSIIIPVYNAEKTIRICFDSVLRQSYKHLEIIIVNDGSDDSSESIILEYQPLFFQEGMRCVYISQENKGLGGAINTGLKSVTGDYLCWIDPDDYLLEKSIEKRLEAFSEHCEVGVVNSNAYVCKEGDKDHLSYIVNGTIMDDPYQFSNHLLGKDLFCAGCHMVKMSCFDAVVPNREIYPARRGQNWQLLLPLYYAYPQFFLNEPLYVYVLYEDSMSRGDSTKEQLYNRYKEHKLIVFNTLNRINMPRKERNKYKHLYNKKYYREMFYESIAFHDYYSIGKWFLKMICAGEFTKADANKMKSLILNRFQKIVSNKL